MKVWAVLGMLFVASPLGAQTTVLSTNPGATFTASPDHYSNYLDGTPKVSSYELDAVAMNSLGAIAISVNLGKPTPDGTMTITVAVPQLSTITPNVVYTATVSAIGPGGSGVSAASNPFGVSALVTPASPVTVKVK